LALDYLLRESGQLGVGQRVIKRSLQATTQPAADGFAFGAEKSLEMRSMPGAAPAEVAGPLGGGALRGRGGYPGSGAGSLLPGTALPGKSDAAEDSSVVTTVLNVGTKTFFRRHERWEDSVLTEQQLKSVKRIERYSDEYFALSRQYGKEVAKYLALEGSVVIVLGDQAYEY
jgi:Ca-activated chloride channel homolog